MVPACRHLPHTSAVVLVAENANSLAVHIARRRSEEQMKAEMRNRWKSSQTHFHMKNMHMLVVRGIEAAALTQSCCRMDRLMGISPETIADPVRMCWMLWKHLKLDEP